MAGISSCECQNEGFDFPFLSNLYPTLYLRDGMGWDSAIYQGTVGAQVEFFYYWEWHHMWVGGGLLVA